MLLLEKFLRENLARPLHVIPLLDQLLSISSSNLIEV